MKNKVLLILAALVLYTVLGAIDSLWNHRVEQCCAFLIACAFCIYAFKEISSIDNNTPSGI